MFYIWEDMTAQIERYVHTFTPCQLIKIQYLLDRQKPRVGSPILHKKIRDLLIEDLPFLTNEELLHLLHAYRNSNSVFFLLQDQFFSKWKAEVQRRTSQL